MKVFSSDCTFDYSWEEVSTANWRKYCPWNHQSTHVTAVDTLSRSVDPTTGILRTERLITCKQTAPAWVQTLLGGGCVSYVHEASYVDPHSQRVTMVSNNLTWNNILHVRETVVYEPAARRPPARRVSQPVADAVNNRTGAPAEAPAAATPAAATPAPSTTTTPPPPAPEKTRFRQEAQIVALCGGWQKIRTKIEEASVERFAENAKKGREGFERVLHMSRCVFGEERAREEARH